LTKSLPVVVVVERFVFRFMVASFELAIGVFFIFPLRTWISSSYFPAVFFFLLLFSSLPGLFPRVPGWPDPQEPGRSSLRLLFPSAGNDAGTPPRGLASTMGATPLFPPKAPWWRWAVRKGIAVVLN